MISPEMSTVVPTDATLTFACENGTLSVCVAGGAGAGAAAGAAAATRHASRKPGGRDIRRRGATMVSLYERARTCPDRLRAPGGRPEAALSRHRTGHLAVGGWMGPTLSGEGR